MICTALLQRAITLGSPRQVRSIERSTWFLSEKNRWSELCPNARASIGPGKIHSFRAEKCGSVVAENTSAVRQRRIPPSRLPDATQVPSGLELRHLRSA